MRTLSKNFRTRGSQKEEKHLQILVHAQKMPGSRCALCQKALGRETSKKFDQAVTLRVKSIGCSNLVYGFMGCQVRAGLTSAALQLCYSPRTFGDIHRCQDLATLQVPTQRGDGQVAAILPEPVHTEGRDHYFATLSQNQFTHRREGPTLCHFVPEPVHAQKREDQHCATFSKNQHISRREGT